MQTLNTILTFSKDLDYGELVRLNYEDSPVETCYFPWLSEAITLVKVTMPDAILLDLRLEDFAECGSFLQDIISMQEATQDYAPKILLSAITAATFHQILATQRQFSYLLEGSLEQEDFITLEEFPIEVLVELIAIKIKSKQESKPAFRNILVKRNPFDSIATALA